MANSQTFTDGYLDIYNTKNVNHPGEQVKLGLELKYHLRYQERTVGIERYENAMQRNVEISLLLRTPRLKNVNPQDVVILSSGEQYQIDRVVYIRDVEPSCMDVSLVKVVNEYERT